MNNDSSFPMMGDDEFMDTELIANRRQEYVKYLKNKLKGAFSFSEWHEQTYNKSLDRHQLEEFVGTNGYLVQDDFDFETEDTIRDMNPTRD